jgi:hypothetical protein
MGHGFVGEPDTRRKRENYVEKMRSLREDLSSVRRQMSLPREKCLIEKEMSGRGGKSELKGGYELGWKRK